MKLIKLTEKVLNGEHTSATTRRAHSPTQGNCDDDHNHIAITDTDTDTHSHNASGQEGKKQRECKAERSFCACATNNR